MSAWAHPRRPHLARAVPFDSKCLNRWLRRGSNSERGHPAAIPMRGTVARSPRGAASTCDICAGLGALLEISGGVRARLPPQDPA